jgi:hypothetical protein
MENKVEYIITRNDLENLYTRVFTDKEWEVLAYEIESLIDYWVEADVPNIISNLDNLVEQDAKFD